METFAEIKELVLNPDFDEQRKKVLESIDYNEIDVPIIRLVKNILKLDYCFTLQSCYGHFLYDGQNNQYSTNPLPILNEHINIDYRIAYIAICIKDNPEGKTFLNSLSKLVSFEPEYIQFGCAEWFWERQINSFVLQVEPERFKNKDKITIDYEEAILVEIARNRFFTKLSDKIERLIYLRY